MPEEAPAGHDPSAAEAAPEGWSALPDAPPLARNRQNEGYIQKNYDYIQRRIRSRLVYPSQARRAGVQGAAEVAFTIREDGSIGDAVIRKTSGSAILDEAALETLRRAAPFRPPPAPARIAIPVVFTLR